MKTARTVLLLILVVHIMHSLATFNVLPFDILFGLLGKPGEYVHKMVDVITFATWILLLVVSQIFIVLENRKLQNKSS